MDGYTAVITDNLQLGPKPRRPIVYRFFDLQLCSPLQFNLTRATVSYRLIAITFSFVVIQ